MRQRAALRMSSPKVTSKLAPTDLVEPGGRPTVRRAAEACARSKPGSYQTGHAASRFSECSS